MTLINMYRSPLAEKMHQIDLDYVEAHPGNENFLPLYGGVRPRRRIRGDWGPDTAPSSLTSVGMDRRRYATIDGGRRGYRNKVGEDGRRIYESVGIHKSAEPWLSYVNDFQKKHKIHDRPEAYLRASESYLADKRDGFKNFERVARINKVLDHYRSAKRAKIPKKVVEVIKMSRSRGRLRRPKKGSVVWGRKVSRGSKRKSKAKRAHKRKRNLFRELPGFV